MFFIIICFFLVAALGAAGGYVYGYEEGEKKTRRAFERRAEFQDRGQA